LSDELLTGIDFTEAFELPEESDEVEAIRLSERQRCWQVVNRLIKLGDLPEPYNERRNGIILASNAIAELGIGNAVNCAGDESKESNHR
jgi:hypothetical protein